MCEWKMWRGRLHLTAVCVNCVHSYRNSQTSRRSLELQYDHEDDDDDDCFN